MPFCADGIAEGVLRELVAFHIEQGTDALIINGSTGEAATMSASEQRRALEIVVDSAGGSIPVIAGVGGSDTAAVADLARAAREVRVDGLLLSPPPYNKPNQPGIIAHYRAVLGAGDLPMIIYNVPGRTACNILPETVEELAGDERIVGVKEASGDISQIAEVARRVGDRVAIYSGNDDQVVPVMALGGKGVISVLANLAPADTSRMAHSFLKGDVQTARELQLRYLPLVATLFSEPNPVPVKAGVRAIGFAVGDVRLPLVDLQPGTRQTLLERMAEVGIGMAGATA
jgi:4-hydroxy-tetrahydrodipicolinate synthase